MLLVAFSRRMCCSRVCSASRSAGRPPAVDRHADEPAGQRPLVRVAAREERGVRSAVAERHAEALRGADDDVGADLARRPEQARARAGRPRPATSPPCSWTCARRSRRRRARAPLEPGYCSSTPNSPSRRAGPSPGRRPRPRCRAARPGSATTAIVCGWQSRSTKNVSPAFGASRWHIAIASAAAVASSSSDALARSIPVRSATIVWKFRSTSSRPCEISGWYGVYAVYQAGFSSTLRRMTPGRDRVRVAHADERGEHLVAVGERPERGERLGLAQRRRAGRAASSLRIDAGTAASVRSSSDSKPSAREHGRLLVGVRPDVPVGECESSCTSWVLPVIARAMVRRRGGGRSPSVAEPERFTGPALRAQGATGFPRR